jgi:outer membrane protein insertion porin family
MVASIFSVFVKNQRRAQRFAAITAVALLAVLVVAAPVARTQTAPAINYEGENVTAIDLASRPEADVEYLRGLIVQKPGEPYSNAKVQQSIAAVMTTKEFTSARVEVSPENSGLRLTFVLEPAYYLGLVQFPGAVPQFSYTRLLQVVTFSEGSPFLRRQMDDATGAMQTFLARNGYFAATVKPRTEIDDEHKLVHPIFEVTLNRRARVGTIDFEGLSEAEAQEQREALGAFWTRFRKGRLKDGVSFTAPRIQAAIDLIRINLGKTNRLAEELSLKSANYDPKTNRADLLFHVKVGPVVTVHIQGAHLFGRTVKRLIPIYQENAYDSDLVAEGRRNLASYFQSKGYFDVKVASQVQESPDQADVIYRVQRGRKHKVESISFAGNHEFDDTALRAAIVIRKKKMLFSRGRYSETLLRVSVNKIVNMYKVMGYPDAQVAAKVDDHEPNVDINFLITEGGRTTVRNFQVVDQKGGENAADAGLDTAKLPAHGLRLEAGKPYSPEFEQEDRNDILAYYLDRGFLSARLNTHVTAVSGDKYKVDVVYQIQPGPQTRVQDVLYLGNVKARTSLIARTAALRPEMPLSETKMLTAESDLYNLGIFDWASVGPRRAQDVTAQLVDPPAPEAGAAGDNPASESDSDSAQGGTQSQTQAQAQDSDPTLAQRDAEDSSQDRSEEVLVKVRESQRNLIEYGGGLEIVSRGGSPPGGAIVIPGLAPIPVGKNFVTSERRFFGPRGSFAYTLHDLRGRGETFTASILGSRLDNRGTLSYGIPRFFGTSWNSLLSGTGERSTLNPIFAATFGEGSFQVERNLDPRRTQTLILRYRLRRTVLSDLLIPDLVLPQDRDIRLSTVSVSYLRDTRDKPLDAHRGIYQTLDFGVTSTTLGASANFVNFLSQSAYYRPLTTNLTWANNLRFGLAQQFASSRVPLSEEFFSGGSDTLRGFPIDGAGPQRPVVACGNQSDASTCSTISVPVGGDMLLILNSELRFHIPVSFPILGERVGAAVFYDGGNVYSKINLPLLWEKYTNSVGIGFRYETPVGPIRFDVGHLLNPIAGISSFQFFVTLGQAF